MLACLYVTAALAWSVTVANWNIQVFGATKSGNATLMDFYAKTVANYDVVFIQEIRDTAQTAFPALCALVGADYACTVSSRAGRSNSKEQYGVMYRTAKVTLKGTKDYNPDTKDRWERPPLCATFSFAGVDFDFYNIHLKPSEVVKELGYLEGLVDSAAKGKNAVVLGDLNADCGYYTPTANKDLSDWNWVISEFEDTTVAVSTCAYDRIIVNKLAMPTYREYGVVREGITKAVSDHYLVWARFEVPDPFKSTPAPATPAPHPSTMVKVANWNLQIFGATKSGDKTLMAFYAKTVANYDIVFIQEIRDTAQTAFPALCALVGADYACTVSSRAGRSNSKEQYGVMYRTAKVTLKGTKDYNPDTKDRWERPPFRAVFELGTAKQEVAFYNLHSKPSDVKNELSNLEDLVNGDSFKGSKVVLGDLNAGCSYYSPTKETEFDKWLWVIPDHEDTTVAVSACCYDRIILNDEARPLYNSHGVLREGITKAVSDHFLVWINMEIPDIVTAAPTDVPTIAPTMAPTATPPTASPETATPKTPAPMTDAPTEAPVPETAAPKTSAPTTGAPKTGAPATDAPKTDSPATDSPATDAPKTEAPSTNPPMTVSPGTPETPAPKTLTPSAAPATNPPATDAPATNPPETNPPATNAPKTDSPATDSPATDAPKTEAPSTNPPMTVSPGTPETPAPVGKTLAPSDAPATNPPETNPPITNPPVTNLPATSTPLTSSPTAAHVTLSPTDARSTGVPTAQPTAEPTTNGSSPTTSIPSGPERNAGPEDGGSDGGSSSILIIVLVIVAALVVIAVIVFAVFRYKRNTEHLTIGEFQAEMEDASLYGSVSGESGHGSVHNSVTFSL